MQFKTSKEATSLAFSVRNSTNAKVYAKSLNDSKFNESFKKLT